MATYRRVLQSRSIRAWYTFSSSSSTLFSKNIGGRQISELAKPNGKRAFVDTLALDEIIQQSDLSKIMSEILSSQEHHFTVLQRETEKMQGDIEEMRSEIRYKFDKLTAGLRLDLNLETSRMRDELAKQNAETTNLSNKLDRDIHAFRAQLEAAKYDVKYCLGTLVSISAVGLALIWIWK